MGRTGKAQVSRIFKRKDIKNYLRKRKIKMYIDIIKAIYKNIA